MVVFIILIVVGVFAYDFGRRWRKQNEWKRHIRGRNR